MVTNITKSGHSFREYNERLIAEERVLEYERMQREYRDIMNYKRKYNLDDQENKLPGIVENESMGCILNIKMTHRHAEDIKYNFANVENENMGCFLNMKMSHRHAESDSDCSEIHPSEKGKLLKVRLFVQILLETQRSSGICTKTGHSL